MLLLEDITIDYYHAVSYALIFFLDCFLVILLFCFFLPLLLCLSAFCYLDASKTQDWGYLNEDGELGLAYQGLKQVARLCFDFLVSF